MRAQEFITERSKLVHYSGIDLNVSIDGTSIDIRAMSNGKQLGYVVFDRDGNTLVADDLSVDEKFQKQGIAKIMYDYVAKELGFKVKASYDQTTLGKKFWEKHQGEKTVWEDQINELFQPGQHWEWTYLEADGAMAKFEVGGIPYFFGASPNFGTPGGWTVVFKIDNDNIDSSSKFGLTGTGNSAQVMSIVVDILRDFLKKYQDKVKALVFSAAEPSRQKLYIKMVLRLLPNWKLTSNPAGNEFTVTAPDKTN